MIQITNKITSASLDLKSISEVNNYRLNNSGPIEIHFKDNIVLDQTLVLQRGDMINGQGHKIRCNDNIPVIKADAKVTLCNLKILISNERYDNIVIDINFKNNFQGNRKLNPTLSDILLVNKSSIKGGIAIRCSGKDTYAQYFAIQNIKINNFECGLLLDGEKMRYLNTCIMNDILIFNCKKSAVFKKSDMNIGSFVLERNDNKNIMVFRSSSRNIFTGVRWDFCKIIFDEYSEYNQIDIKSSGDKPAWENNGKFNSVSFVKVQNK
jgi:hypothetical protein